MTPRGLSNERRTIALALRVVAVFAISLFGVGSASAGLQLFEGSWVVKAFGNERTGGTGDSEFYSAIGIPLGRQCNSRQPRCPYESTPTDGKGNFAPLGGSLYQGLYCAPWLNWGGHGTTMRPEWSPIHCPGPFSFALDGLVALTHGFLTCTHVPFPRNPAFFTPSGQPNVTNCDPRSTALGGLGSLGGGPGAAQAGRPLTGDGIATTTRTLAGPGGFQFASAPHVGATGIRGTREGELPFDLPYAYHYTYARLRNAKGVFGPNLGPGSFSIPYQAKGVTVAKVAVKQGAAKFGGTMRMLGALTSKVCYYRNGGCSLGRNHWHYNVIGTAAPYTDGAGVITKGYQALTSAVFFNSGLGQFTTLMVVGSRFSWTTGSVTVTAARGPRETVHYAMGYDNRTPTSGKGIVQLVSPVLTHWLLPGASHETAGIGILRLKFVPEPRAWVTLLPGLAMLVVACRLRR